MQRKGQAMTGSETIEAEGKRDRVRRLLIGPMEELGFRKPGDVSREKHRQNMDRLADELAYMSEQGFARLREALRCQGRGKGRDGWPPLACVFSYAQLAEPRPLDDLPALRRWFASAAGREAEAQGRLVEEYDFWCAHRRPPVRHSELAGVTERARDNARRLDLALDRMERGVDPGPGEREWAHDYQARKARVRALIDGAGA